MYIVENSRSYLSDFVRLNEQWIIQYFNLEAADHALAANPGEIIDNGGYIFCLLDNNEVIGVCALFKDPEAGYELARMAVSPLHQNRGCGHKLIEVCINKLREIGETKVYLTSNTKLKAAIALYKKYGFTTVSTGQHPKYSRANIVMELQILK